MMKLMVFFGSGYDGCFYELNAVIYDKDNQEVIPCVVTGMYGEAMDITKKGHDQVLKNVKKCLDNDKYIFGADRRKDLWIFPCSEKGISLFNIKNFPDIFKWNVMKVLHEYCTQNCIDSMARLVCSDCDQSKIPDEEIQLDPDSLRGMDGVACEYTRIVCSDCRAAIKQIALDRKEALDVIQSMKLVDSDGYTDFWFRANEIDSLEVISVCDIEEYYFDADELINSLENYGYMAKLYGSVPSEKIVVIFGEFLHDNNLYDDLADIYKEKYGIKPYKIEVIPQKFSDFPKLPQRDPEIFALVKSREEFLRCK